MAAAYRGHDDRLLDALDELKRHAFEGAAWRVVREGRAAFDGSRGSGRWNPSDLSVLYTALAHDGAMAEMHFHISLGQTVFPSRIRHDICEISTKTERTLVLANMKELVALGVEESRYREFLYGRTQEIASAAAFMGFDGLIGPSARYDCQNLVLFLDSFNLENLEVTSREPIDWAAWRSQNIGTGR